MKFLIFLGKGMFFLHFKCSRYLTVSKKYFRFKRSFLAKRPHEKWMFIRQIHYHMCKVVGVEFMKCNYKMNINTIIPLYLQVDYYVLLVYSMFYYKNEPIKVLMATTILGFFIPVSLLFLNSQILKRHLI